MEAAPPIPRLRPEDIESIRQLVAENELHSIADDVKESHKFKHVADIAEIMSRLLAGFASILAFVASSFPKNDTILAFSAGLVGSVGVVTAGWSFYAGKEAKERQARINAVLGDVGIRTMPELVLSTDENAPTTSAPTTSSVPVTP